MKILFGQSLHLARLSVFLFVLLIHTLGHTVSAQCISAFPYNENFEAAPAWTSGGANSDWAWGTPSHAFINTAGSGTKAWCVGGLTGSFYEYSAQSWLMSPCFDFSGLDYPWISFKIFWETEWKWDGLVFQYSIDGGSTWDNVGAFGDAEDCLNENWYNHNNVSWLTSASNKHGWSGRIGATIGSCQGGNGSGAWITAKHCMSNLAGEPNVRFRFLFGSGMTCNDFDGAGIDDILIQEAPGSTVSFVANCTSANTVSFTSISAGCPTGYAWNFGDPASGGSNLSVLENPTHTFSGPGTYNVTFTSTQPCSAPTTFTQTVSILSANAEGANVSCNGLNNGSAAASVVGGSGVYTYAWNTVPAQTTATISGLSPGTYSVTVSNPGSCPAEASVTITEPTVLTVETISAPSCADVCNGSVTATAAGGTAPYAYNWAALGAGATITHTVCTGNYSVTASDANGCTASNNVEVDTNAAPVLQCTSPVICTGSSGHLTATGAHTYTWFPATGLSAGTGSTVVASPAETTAYILTGTSTDGCSSSMDVLVTVDPSSAPVAVFTYTPALPDVFNPEVQLVNQSAGQNTYTWFFAGLGTSTATDTSFVFPTDSAGHYNVCLVAVNPVGCSDTLCQLVTINGLVTLYVPNAFTPNGDGINELFFPVVRDVDWGQVSWMVFNRWGQLIFEAHDPYAAWDGSHHGIRCEEGVYIWKIRYIEKNTGIQGERTGQVTLVR